MEVVLANRDFIDKSYGGDADPGYTNNGNRHLNKNYETYVRYSFPRLTPGSYLPSKFNSVEQANTYLSEQIRGGRDTNWTNQTLSYMKRDVISKRIISKIIMPTLRLLFQPGEQIRCVDATANIGGDTLSLGLLNEVSSVVSYEPNPAAYKMLCENVKLYGLESKVTTLNTKFDYNVDASTIVILDPPFESVTGLHGCSIESYPIYEVVEQILATGCRAVLLNAPSGFQYNLRYARDHGQRISVAHIANKKMKLYTIGRNAALPNLIACKIIASKKVNSRNIDTRYNELYLCKKVKIY